jgi:Fe-S-cluster containining protein
MSRKSGHRFCETGHAQANSQRAAAEALCQSCGACCAFSAEWPRFSLESDAALALIPPACVDDANGRMRCVGNRCAALTGEVGVAVSCAVYAVRPLVCRECQPGDPECQMARRHYGLAPLSPSLAGT